MFTLLILSILHSMWSGKSLYLMCIFPFGMLCLSANSKILVNNLLAVCMSVGIVVCEKAVSICGQLSCSWCMGGQIIMRVLLSTMSYCIVFMTPR